MGIRFPLPAPSNLFVCNMLQGREVSKWIPPVQIRYTAHQAYFQYFTVLEAWLGGKPSIYRLPLHTLDYGVRSG
jgi:hypothetical protein